MNIIQDLINNGLDEEQARELIKYCNENEIDVTTISDILPTLLADNSTPEKLQENIEKVCEKVGVPTEIYARVVGYMSPLSQWNRGKRAEFSERKMIKLKKENYN